MGEEDCVQVKLTVTFVLFQPWAFGNGEAEPTMFGSVSSTFRVTVAGSDVFPATSVAVADTV